MENSPTTIEPTVSPAARKMISDEALQAALDQLASGPVGAPSHVEPVGGDWVTGLQVGYLGKGGLAVQDPGTLAFTLFLWTETNSLILDKKLMRGSEIELIQSNGKTFKISGSAGMLTAISLSRSAAWEPPAAAAIPARVRRDLGSEGPLSRLESGEDLPATLVTQLAPSGYADLDGVLVPVEFQLQGARPETGDAIVVRLELESGRVSIVEVQPGGTA